ncbi:hypothetical protein [Xylella fastidiosa]|uniref:hypothetical protein n=1 Tax=Xylella fastidiosa TaxID=2371 RepID=UPI000057A5D8|nr:hypothetical protein [Xylella fastidiosa]UIX80873.1 hypothetical protein LZ756_10410 [Xylella fastidiosa subsp. sandyi]
MKKFEMDVSGDVSHVVANEWIHALSGVVGAMPGVGFVSRGTRKPAESCNLRIVMSVPVYVDDDYVGR